MVKEKSVEFLSYTGAYPNLCCGMLTLKINGVIATFGVSMDAQYPEFWCSGGRVWFDRDWCDHVESGPWQFNEKKLPEIYRPFANEIFAAFNENVPHGCCGGCI